MPSIFLSHNSKDKPFARRLAATLKARGIQVWFDEAEMLPGDSLIDKIERAIDAVDYLAVVLSPNSVSSQWVLKEVRVALHREISGKRIVVIPCLYAQCQLPPFLEDKIYADFRDPEGYDSAVDAIVARVRRDFKEDNEGLAEALKWVEDAPFTKLWRTALATRSFSDRFANVVKDVLGEMKPVVNWSPQIFASYLFFLKEIREQAISDVRLWELLLQVIEETAITASLRYETLECTFLVFKPFIQANPERMRRLFREAKHHDLRLQIFEKYLDVRRDAQADTATDLLTEVWSVLDRTTRRQFADSLISFVSERGDEPAAMRPILADAIDGEISHDAFNRLRAVWKESRSLDNQDHYRELVNSTLQDLTLPERGEAARRRLLDLHRTASTLQEEGDYWLYAYLIETVTSERLKVAREVQGEHLVLGLLSDIIKDQEVEVVLSVLALGAVLHEGYGAESLLLDDELIPSLLKPKMRGDPRISLIQALCESFRETEEEDNWSALVLGAVYSVMSETERADVIRIVERDAVESKRLQLLSEYLQGGLTWESFEKKIRALAKAADKSKRRKGGSGGGA